MEEIIFYFIRMVASPWLDFLMVILSETCIYVVVLILINFLYARREKFMALFISILGSVAVGTILKSITSLPRPCESSLLHIHRVFVNGVLYCRDSVFPFEFGTSSFPSVHAAILFAALPFMTHKKGLFIGYLCYAIVTSISRIYLGVHYPHDVVVGAFIGVSIGELTIRKIR